ncbi:hypothetical protein PAK06_06675 [Campylobacter jejuni]|nr:hypothetical protein [Campylobacter jejuni]EDP7224549.1 hypothetical protein [Campylobacter jejuni]ELW3014699.1 hypothetical protein [Campylobacter jejuni]MDN2926831.1 hypothetical protein [Campylobacter jejuni]HEF6282108.1 hypothetical protein [Campylobacter jejuni]
MTKIFSENNKKEIQDIFKKMIDLAMKFYNDRNSTFKDDIEDIQNFLKAMSGNYIPDCKHSKRMNIKGLHYIKKLKKKSI